MIKRASRSGKHRNNFQTPGSNLWDPLRETLSLPGDLNPVKVAFSATIHAFPLPFHLQSSPSDMPRHRVVEHEPNIQRLTSQSSLMLRQHWKITPILELKDSC